MKKPRTKRITDVGLSGRISPAMRRIFDEILSRIRTQGSLLRSAGLAGEEYGYEDWNTVMACGKMIQEDAERALDLLDKFPPRQTINPTFVERQLESPAGDN